MITPNEEQELSGSRSVNDTGIRETTEEGTNAEVAEVQTPDELATTKERLANAEKLIGRHSGEVAKTRQENATLKAELEKLTPKGPSIEEQIDAISDRMETGELSLRDGNREIAKLSATLGKQSALSEIETRTKQERVQSVQQGFLEKNPDYHEVVASGVLKPIMDEDPMADEYTAFRVYKKEQELKAQMAEALDKRGKIVAGADNAGKVLGRAGIAPRPGEGKKFTSSSEAIPVMTDALAQFRASQNRG